MSPRPDIEYTVILVFPGFGDERDNAEQVIEEALNYLNTQKDEPGMRFAYNVSARLEIVADVDEARARLETDDDLAMMILHDLDDEEKLGLTEECAARGVLVCHAEAGDGKPRKRPRSSRGKPGEWKVVIGKRTSDEPRAHKILASTLTDPLDDDDQETLMDRVGQLIAVLALGVMEHHWTRNPPHRLAPE
jgi:hypothetical protein